MSQTTKWQNLDTEGDPQESDELVTKRGSEMQKRATVGDVVGVRVPDPSGEPDGRVLESIGGAWSPVPRFHEAERTVTVGGGGDYATVNEALRDLSRRRPVYEDATEKVDRPWTVDIVLLSDFELAEQIIVTGQNLSWIRISAEDPEVPVVREALTTQIGQHHSHSTQAALVAMDGAVAPIINCLFAMDGSGEVTRQDGFFALAGSTIVCAQGAHGIKNAGRDGLVVSYGSTFVGREAVFSGAGRVGHWCHYDSRSFIRDGDLSMAGSHGIEADNGALVSALGVNVADAGQDGALSDRRGVYARDAATVDVMQATIDRAAWVGVHAEGASTVNARGSTANDCGNSAYRADTASTINAKDTEGHNAGAAAYRAFDSSVIHAEDAQATGAAEEGVRCRQNSRAMVRGADFDGAGSTAVHAEFASTIDAWGAVATNAGGRGVWADRGSTVNAGSIDVEGYSTYGIHAHRGSTVNAEGASAQQDGETNSGNDIRVEHGSTINATGASGGTNRDKNEVHPDGIIFDAS